MSPSAAWAHPKNALGAHSQRRFQSQACPTGPRLQSECKCGCLSPAVKMGGARAGPAQLTALIPKCTM